MIVNQIDVMDVSVREPKNNTPIAGDRNAPLTLPVAFQWVEPQARKVHISRVGSDVQERKDILQTVSKGCMDFTPIAAVVQAPQSAMSEARDHQAL
jgi:hypothetical protein